MPQLLVLYLGSLTLRSLCLMAFAGLVTLCLRNVAIRHAVWVVTLGSILLLPFMDAVVPAAPVTVPILQIAVQPSFRVLSEASKPSVQASTETEVNRPPVGRQPHDWWQVTLIVYAAVAGFLLLRTVIAYGRVWHLRRRSHRVEAPAFREMLEAFQFRWQSPRFVESPFVRVPVTVGFFKPVVLLPEAWHSWSAWDLRAVVAHELAHVRRADWAIRVIAGLNRCLFWFNPLSWWLERKLCSLAEQASDEASLSLVGDAPRYAEVLLAFAAEAKDGHRLAGGMAMARLNIRARIDRILALQRPQSGILKRAGWIAIMVAVTPVLYLVAAGQGAPPPRPATRVSEPSRLESQVAPQQPRQAEPQIQTQTKPDLQIPDPAIEPDKLKVEKLIEDAFKANSREGLARIYQDAIGQYHDNLIAEEYQRGLLSEAEAQKAKNQDFLGRWLNTNDAFGLTNDTYKLPPNITLPPNSYAFLLTGTQGGTVSFRRAEGTIWKAVSYGCQTCSFFVNENGVGPENLGGPGILFKMEEKATQKSATSPTETGDLTLTCRARECWATQVSPWSIDPVAARFKFDVAKFDMERAPNLSQVLIIVSR